MSATVAGLVLAAGSSRRLGEPKQLLPFGIATLLDASLNVGRAAPFSQRLVTLGGAAADVQGTVGLDGYQVVDSVHYTDGCSSSIVSALPMIDPNVDGIVMLLGDQPGVEPSAIDSLIEVACQGETVAPLAVCSYLDGIGHPFWFGREVFDDLAKLHGDKAVWKLIESGKYPVTRVSIPTDVPLDVDTWDDYSRLLAQHGQAAT